MIRAARMDTNMTPAAIAPDEASGNQVAELRVRARAFAQQRRGRDASI